MKWSRRIKEVREIARFVSIGKYYINADRILTVTPPDMSGSIWIELDSGQTIEAEAKYLPDVLGTGQESPIS